MLSLAGTLATAHRAVHRVTAPAELPALRDVLADRIHDAVLPSDLRGFALGLLDDLPDGERLFHGDWAGAARGDAAADHARALLLLRWANPLPGTPPSSRALIAAGRSMLARRYIRAYRRGLPPPPHLDSWLLVHVAARLSEGIPAEHALLTGILQQGGFREWIETPIDDYEALTGVTAGQGLTT
ncbi:hypothetical protein ACIA5D_03700 [Actinoplanes sp. NPDC051513]|uniref:hypothetical protein n=1 Tax=Actinoplanes sp. NPDC051513 TaxID=3363908 RepID=UPI0037AC8861